MYLLRVESEYLKATFYYGPYETRKQAQTALDNAIKDSHPYFTDKPVTVEVIVPIPSISRYGNGKDAGADYHPSDHDEKWDSSDPTANY